MARAQLTNNGVTTLSAAASASDTTLYLAAGGGGKFPSSGYFYVTLLDSANVPEIVKVTSRAVDQLTVVRAQDGTSARSFSSSASVRLNLVAAVLNELVPADGTGATGTWGISISGNAATATSATSATSASVSTTQAQFDSGVAIATTAFVDRLRDVPLSTNTTATLTIADRGCMHLVPSATTVPASVFSAGNVVSVLNTTTSSLSLIAGSGLTMIMAGTTNTGTRTLLANGMATLYFQSPTQVYVSGNIS